LHTRFCFSTATLLLLAAAVACEPRDAQNAAANPSPVWSGETAWRLSEQPRLIIAPGDPRDRPEGRPLDPVSAFRLRDGRYVVSDGYMNGWHALLVYDGSGRFLHQLGRKGSGPSEFKYHYQWAGQWRGDSIAGYDISLTRIQIWSPDGTFARTLTLPVRERAFFMSDGYVVMRGTPSKAQLRGGHFLVPYNLHGPNGEFVRELMSISVPRSAMRVDPDAPNYAIQRIYAAGKHRWYAGEWNEFKIDVYDTLGVKLHTLERRLTRKAFPDSERDEAIRIKLRFAGMGPEAASEDQMTDLEKGLRRRARWPETVPAFQQILEDEVGNAWVQHYYFLMAPNAHPTDGRKALWSVFDPNGRFLGEVQTPSRFDVISITADQVLGFWLDEHDVEHVHVYDLLKASSSTN